MSTYKVEICGVNTAQLPILKEEEKDELFKKIKAGDKASRETYIMLHPPVIAILFAVIRLPLQYPCGRSVPDWLYRTDEGNR